MAKNDANEVEPGATIDYEVAVVGAGAAGIAIARTLATHGVHVGVFEAGGSKADQATQALYEGEANGSALPSRHRYLTRSRLRYFGGTTNHWDGACAPIPPWAFTGDGRRPFNTWPIRRQDLDPYYERAAPYVGIEAIPTVAVDYEATPDLVYRLPEDAPLVQYRFHYSGGPRLGRRFAHEFGEPDGPDLWSWANVVRIALAPDGRAVEHIEASTLGGRRFRIRAKHFVLAAGGIENVRLLLNSDDVQRAGVGNDHDLVGRHFMDHLAYRHTTAVVMDPLRDMTLYLNRKDDELGHRRQLAFSISPAERRRHDILDANIRLIRKSKPEKWPELTQAVDQLARTTEHLDTERSAPWVALARMVIETEPHRDNRITLTRKRDALGMRQVKLHWDITERDRRTVTLTTQLLARCFPLLVGARVHETDVRRRPGKQYHHAGTLRMHEHAKSGVVDGDCKVHGVDNLHITGSAVFTTLTSVNPTFTIAALAIRLGDHLAQLLGHELSPG